MAAITFQWDSRELDFWKGPGIERAATRALTKAGNDALRAMKIASTRAVRGRKRFKVARVKKALPVVFPRASKAIESLVWRMDVSGVPVPLADFPHTQTRRGVTVAVNNGKRKLIKSAFVATLRSGHTGIFRRRGKARLPIDELFTTRVSDVFDDTGMVPAVQERALDVFQSAFDRLFPLELQKLGA